MEIGVGLGALTEKLLKTDRKLILFEIDKGFAEYLRSLLPSETNQVVLIEGDVLQELPKWEKEKVYVYGNLPYHITTDILKLVANDLKHCLGGSFVVQKEFAERIVSETSSFSVYLKYFGKWELIRVIPKTVFYPKPKVDSALMRYTAYPDVPRGSTRDKGFETFLRAVFWGKRKQISVSLGSSPFLQDPKTIENLLLVFSELGIPPQSRPDSLTPEDFFRIWEQFLAKQKITE